MKKVDIITENDARVLPRGETVLVARGGHVTPLAQDTLKERGITVVHEARLAASDEALAPPETVRSIAISSDHTGIKLRRALVAFLRSRGLAVQDLGTDSSEPVDYPDTAARVARSVSRGEADAGIVIDGAGIGSSITANKVKGVRAAVCHDVTMARYARQHNGANVLSLGSTLVSQKDALAVVDVWISTPMKEPRYIRRLAKIRAVEDRG